MGYLLHNRVVKTCKFIPLSFSLLAPGTSIALLALAALVVRLFLANIFEKRSSFTEGVKLAY